MKNRFIIRREDILEALRTAGWALLLAGALLGTLADTPQMHAWAKGAIMVGAGLWSAWALLKPQGLMPTSQRQM